MTLIERHPAAANVSQAGYRPWAAHLVTASAWACDQQVWVITWAGW
jgi:hypothetical protein